MREKNNPKYAFYYLLSLVALVFMAISVGLIAFGIIDRTIADVLSAQGYTNYNNQFKFAISALFISIPVYYFVVRLIQRGLRKEELGIDSGIRRWLTYFIILVSSLIILGVFIGVINNFLSGELSTRFILKAVFVFLIAATVFSYYFYDIKRTDVIQKDRVVKIFFISTLIFVLAAFVAAWFFVESPKEARNRRLDEIVINNMYNLESALNTYYERYKKLPESLIDLENEQDIYFEKRFISNPETDSEIEYKKIDDDSFELCAEFRTSSYEIGEIDAPYYRGGKNHNLGYQCLAGNLWSKEKIEALPVMIE